MRKILFLLLLITTAGINKTQAVVRTSTSNGNWNTPTTWSPNGIPNETDDIIIRGGHQPNINSTAISCRTLTIQSGGSLNINSGKKLTVHHTDGLVIQGELKIDGGDITILSPGTQFTIDINGTVIWNPQTNTSNGATLFKNCIEDLKPTSTLIIKKWYDLRTGPGEVISGSFGNLTIQNISAGWRMNNCFEAHPIFGTLTISSSYIILDTTGTIHQTSIGAIQLTNPTALLDIYRGDRNIGFSLNTNSISINGGELNLINGECNGNCQLKVNGDMKISDYGTFIGVNGGNASLSAEIQGNMELVRSTFYGIWGGEGNADLNIQGNLSTYKSGNQYSEFYGIVDGNGNTKIHINGDLNNQGYTSLIWNTGVTGVGNGNGSLLVDGTFSQSDGDFRGCWNATTNNAGSSIIEADSLLFTGGIFMGSYSCSAENDTVQLRFNKFCSITFSNSSNIFRGVGMETLAGNPNQQSFRLTSHGQFNINGIASGEFSTSYGYGNEINIFTDGLNLSAGINKFAPATHKIQLYSSEINCTGGNTYLSYAPGEAEIQAGNLLIENGNLHLKNNSGRAKFNVIQNFSQTGGLFNLYSNLSNNSPDSNLLITGGDFSQTGGVFNFSNNANKTGADVLILQGTKMELGGNGKITSIGAGTARHLGQIRIAHAYPTQSPTSFYRNSSSHLTEQTQLIIQSGSTLQLSNGELQISSLAENRDDMLIIEPGAKLDCKANSISSNGQSTYSSINNNGTLSTRHKNGLYNGTSDATINATSNLIYKLHPQSIVEYISEGTTTISGYGYGNATTEDQKYGQLILKTESSSEPAFTIKKDLYTRTATNHESGILKLNKNTFFTGQYTCGATAAVISEDKQAINQSRLILGALPPYGNGFEDCKLQFADEYYQLIPISIDCINNTNNGALEISTRKTEVDNLPLPGTNHVNAVTTLSFNGSNISTSSLIDRYYEIHAPGITAEYELGYHGSENTTDIFSAQGILTALIWNGNKWTEIPCTETGVTNLSESGKLRFTASDLSGPIALKTGTGNSVSANFSLKVNPLEQENNCNWNCEYTHGVLYFELESSNDDIHYQRIHTIEILTNNGDVRNFRFSDQSFLGSLTYYRVKQINANGGYCYSNTVKVDRSKGTTIQEDQMIVEAVYPNPFTDQITIKYAIKNPGATQFLLFNSAGQTISQHEQEATEGSNSFTIRTSEQLPPGNYVLHVINGTKKFTQKLIRAPY